MRTTTLVILQPAVKAFINEVITEWDNKAAQAMEAHRDGVDGAYSHHMAATRVGWFLTECKRPYLPFKHVFNEQDFMFSLEEESQAESMAGCK